MPRLSSVEYAALMERRYKASHPDLPADSALESVLQSQIQRHCDRNQWIAYTSRMDKRTTSRIGQPDFVISADRGRTFYIECKSRLGKLTSEQRGLAQWAAKLGHTIHLVRSFEEFLNVVAEDHRHHD